jgi:hypothetical protein
VAESGAVFEGNYIETPGHNGLVLVASWNNQAGRGAASIRNNIIININSGVGQNSAINIGESGSFGTCSSGWPCWSSAGVYNNTVYTASNSCVTVDNDNVISSNNVTVENNICQATGGISGSILTNDYNDCFNGTTGCTGTHTITSNPNFVSTSGPPASNFALQPGSPAIGAGTTISGFSTDYFGNTPVVPWDMGAAQSATGGTPQITVQTNPPGLQIAVDGAMFTAPQNFSWSPGTNHTIATTSPQGAGGTRTVFANWSDGLAISHTVIPTANTTYTANFTTRYLLTTGVSPADSGTIGTTPASADGYYDSGTPVQVSASVNFGHVFSSWSGDITGSANPVSLVMSGPESVTANFNVVAPSGLRFVPVAPCRVADTRNAPDPFGGPVMAANSTRDFTIPSSNCGIPSTALAYSFNVTVVPTTRTLGYLSIWPTGQPQPPLASTLNSIDGRIKANAAIVGAGTSGAVSVFVLNDSHVILDINGYFALPASAPSGLVFYPLTPCRVMDTRLPIGPLGGPMLTGGASQTVPMLSSSCGLPATAAAYSLNMTVVPPDTLNYLTTWPSGAAQPLVSTLNDPTGTVVANAAIVPAGTGGSIDVFVTQQTHLIIDVNGYFAPPGARGLLFYPATPCRVVDTRKPPGPFGGPAFLGQRDFNMTAGQCGMPATTAYSLNATVVPQASLAYLTLWPTDQLQPFVSTLNSLDASIVSNAAIVNAAMVPTILGMISAFSTDLTDLILDLNGFFAP